MAKILLIEDDPMIYKMYDRLFKHEGYETEVADDGQKGLDKLATFQPDIILLDIMMPNMNGVEVLTNLKADPKTQNIPVVVLTNVSDMNISHEVLSKGANLIIIKSQAEPDQVLAWIRSVLDKSTSQPSDDAAQTDTSDSEDSND